MSTRSRGRRRGEHTVPLIGTAMATGRSAAPTLAGETRSVVVRTHEFAGDLDERLDFPAEWHVRVMQMAGHDAPVLTPSQLAEEMDRPVGTRTLRELAQGKRTVAIVFDDLSRATPTSAVTPWVTSELRAAGVRDENVLFIASLGAHRPMTAVEVAKKLGREAAARYAWVNHNAFDNLTEVGRTTFKNRILLNRSFVAADLKICLSGVKVHQDAGYGGGAKAVLPGVAGLTSVEHSHTAVLRDNRTCGPVRVFRNEMRLDMNEAARLAKVDFTVQLVFNQRRRPIRAVSGDVVDAHHAAARIAARTYCTPTFEDADIVVANAYPQNAQPRHAERWVARSVRRGGTGVLIVQHPLAQDPVHYLSARLAHRRLSSSNPKGYRLIVYSQYASRTMMNTFPRETQFCDRWADVVESLRARHPGDVRVAVYPYAAIQHQEIALDG
jgi:hypothetical protein